MGKKRSVESHLGTLRGRFSEKRLEEAARRRAHLNYQSLRFGDAPGTGKVRFLLAQMHQNYYFGYFETVCALGGIILEQALVLKLRDRLRSHKVLVFQKGTHRRWIQNPGEILEYGLTDLLNYAHEEGLLPSRTLIRYAHQIRWIRNMVIHERMPVFRECDDGHLEMKLARSRRNTASYATIRLAKDEVTELGRRRGEVTAYYCVTRLREILKGLLSEDGQDSGVEHEDSGSLFHWEEEGKDTRGISRAGQRHGEPGPPG
ncbi:MAG: hypothetical protein JXB46_09040 [Candidatus Eisenbacteria bacterium]|nr:hypothetical protein [Candidatus Eisenbacteria bacterium]